MSMKKTMMLKFGRLALAGVVASVLTACGGGGGDAGTSKYPSTTNAENPISEAASPATLLLSLSQSSVKNTDTAEVVATAVVVNSSGQAMSGVPVTYSVVGGVVTPGGLSDALGKVTASVNFTTDRANRIVTVTAKAGSLQESKTFAVSGVRIAATLLPAIVAPGNPGAMEITVLDAASNGLSDQRVSITGLGNASLVTDNSGKATYNYTVPAAFSGSSLTFKIESSGVSQQQEIVVQQASGGVVIPNATGPIGVVTPTADPSVLETNADGGTNNQTTVRLKVVNGSTNPLDIENVRVSFDLNGDPLGVGGRFTSGSNVVYTSSTGVASTTYIPGTKATGTGALNIRACYSLTDFTPDPTGRAANGSASCPNSVLLPITINDEALNITVGSVALVGTTSDGRYYTDYVVQVNNASGLAKPNVLITPTLDLTGYEKGFYTKPDGEDWTQVLTLPGGTRYLDRDVVTNSYDGCANEDANRDGIRSGSEDRDSDTVLEPRKADAAVSYLTSGVNKTDATGAVSLRVTYLKNVAGWLRIKLYVRGTVSGTEGEGKITEVLLPPITDVQAEGRPAFATNPYGAGTSCSVH